MITSIEIENFKAFGKRVRIPLAPLTLLYGENSAGKSSILQALGVISQTLNNRTPGAVLVPSVKDGLVDLGSFNDLVYNHQSSDRSVKLYFEFTIDDDKSTIPHFTRAYISVLKISHIGVQIEIESSSSEPHELNLKTFEIYFNRSDTPFVSFNSSNPLDNPFGWRELKCSSICNAEHFWEILFEGSKSKRIDIANLLENALRDQPIDELQSIICSPDDVEANVLEETKKNFEYLWQLLNEGRDFFKTDYSLSEYIKKMSSWLIGSGLYFNGLMPEAWNYSLLNQYLLKKELVPSTRFIHPSTRKELSPTIHICEIARFCGQQLREEINKFSYLGPLREAPKRLYTHNGLGTKDVGKVGELLPDMLFKDPALLQEVNSWLVRLGVDYRIIVNRLVSKDEEGHLLQRDYYELLLIDTRRSSSVTVTFADVGFGISQLLPFVVQCLAYKTRLIVVEQPEIHIHPHLQTELGDLIIDSIQKNGNRFIIETHSEHLILRLQRRIREDVVKPEDISVNYILRGVDGSTQKRLRLNAQGRFIDNWPGGFFPERLDEIM